MPKGRRAREEPRPGTVATTDARARPVFFVHVMKTGGSTLLWQLLADFPPHLMYPNDSDRRDEHDFWPSLSVRRLIELPEERKRRTRLYSGHFPFAASQLLGIGLTTVAVVREPVDRTVSHLRHLKRRAQRFRDKRLEEIYEDETAFRTWIHNHQTKVFGLTAAETAPTVIAGLARPLPEEDVVPTRPIIHVMEADDERLAIARRQLGMVDALGLTEHYDEFVEHLRARFGWKLPDLGRLNTSERTDDVDPAFLRRIADDNAVDCELYEHARTLWRERARA
jgi:hypothetical protein